MGKNYGGLGAERKTYGKLTAQIAKNMVKKKIIGIIQGGARAADEFIDSILEDGENSTCVWLTAKRIIERNRAKWRNFIIEAANSFDPDALSCFGVDFVYGGLMTASTGNVGWASVIEMDGRREEGAQIALETVLGGRPRGNLVWIIKGRELFSPDMLKIYRFCPECAFILIPSGENDGELCSGVGALSAAKLKNVLVIAPNSCKRALSELRSHGILFAVTGGDNNGGTNTLGAKIGAFNANNGAFDSKNGALNANNSAFDSKNGALNAKNGAFDSKNGALNAKNGAFDSKNGISNERNGAIGANNAFDIKSGALGANGGSYEARNGRSGTGRRSASANGGGRGREGAMGYTVPASLWRFLESPSLPLRAEGFEELFDDVENLLSGGKNRRMPRYIL